MTEATVVRNITRYLRDRLPQAVTFKHNDRVTAGIPDISVTTGGRTVWFEVKVIADWNESPAVLRKRFEALQLSTMVRLARAGAAFYLVALRNGKMLDIVAPQQIFGRLYQDKNVAGLEAHGPFAASLPLLVSLITSGGTQESTHGKT